MYCKNPSQLELLPYMTEMLLPTGSPGGFAVILLALLGIHYQSQVVTCFTEAFLYWHISCLFPLLHSICIYLLYQLQPRE